MPASPGPWFIKIEYHSEFSPHVSILPINTVDLNEASPEESTVLAWDASTVNWVDMVTALCNGLKTHYPTSHVFDTATLYGLPVIGEPPVYHSTVALAINGTDSTPGTTKAAQQTITARDTDGFKVKLVLLDFASNDIWGKFTTIAGADIADITDEWASPSNGWSSRHGARPNTLISTTRKFNNRLRRAYRIA